MRESATGGGENYMHEELHNFLSGKMRGDEIGGACSTYYINA
jgi:hypothetical protein